MKGGRLMMIYGALALVGVGAVLSGCGQTATEASPEEQAAKDQFLAERSGGTPVVSDTVTLGEGGRQMPGVIGTVEKIESNRVTVKSPFDGTSTTVQLADGAKVSRQADGELSEIKVGDSVTAIGSKEGETLQADMVRLGDVDGAMDGPMMFAGGPAPGGAGGNLPGDNSQPMIRRFPGGAQGGGSSGGQGVAPGGGMLSGEMPEVVSGTVEKIEGNTITLKDKDGKSTTVEVKESANVLKQVDIKPSEVKVGETVSAIGTRKDGVLEATRLQVMPGLMRVERP